ncbi:MAG: hypothetical protein ACR2KN_06835 [Geodermatophilaceae bacterium]
MGIPSVRGRAAGQPPTSRVGLEGIGFQIVERPQPSFLFAESVLIAGEVARSTDFERGFAAHQAFLGGAGGAVHPCGGNAASLITVTVYARPLDRLKERL